LSRAGGIGLAFFVALASAPGCKRAPPEPLPERIPAPAAKSTIRFAVFGDYGDDSADEARVAALVKSWNVDFVVTTGDNNYPSGDASTIDAHVGKYYASFIGGYHGAYGPGSPVNRFWPSPGNHDWGTGLGAYVDYFTLPGNERYYDVDLGLVHLYAIDSDPHEPDGATAESKQGDWLKARLASSHACYDVVYFHHPPYSSARHGSTEAMRWPFKAWGAEVVFAGHDHTYERLEVDGIPYFVCGLGGAEKYGFYGTPLPQSHVRFNDDYGAMLVTATPEAITYEFFAADAVRRDALTVKPPAPCTK